MKARLNSVTIIAALLLGLLSLPAISFSEISSESILGQAESRLSKPGGYEYLLRLEVLRDNRLERSYTMKMLSRGNDQMIIRFISPPQMKDQAVLKNRDQQWLYFPRIRRSMNVSKLQSLAGSDFAYGDILNLDLTRDYRPKLREESTDAQRYHLILTAKSPNSLYDRVDYTIRKRDFAPVERVYYTKTGKRLKTLTFSDYDASMTPKTWKMTSRLQRNSVTIMYIEYILQRDDLTDDTFTIQALERRMQNEFPAITEYQD